MSDPTAILDERARALARPPDPPEPEGMLDVLLVRAGGERLAVPADRVREVLPPAALACVPGALPPLAGVRHVRGELLAVADLAVLAGTGGESREGWTLVIDDDTAPVAVLVDAAEGLARFPRDAVVPVAGDRPGTRCVLGMAEDDLLVVDVDAVLADRRLWIGEPEESPEGTQ